MMSIKIALGNFKICNVFAYPFFKKEDPLRIFADGGGGG